MRTTTNPEDATCRGTDVDVQLFIGLGFRESEVEPQLKKRRFGVKTPAAGGKKGKKVDDAVVETKVTIPMLVNSEPLRDGRELLLYKAKAAPRPRASTPNTMMSLVKTLEWPRHRPQRRPAAKLLPQQRFEE